jgi:hypothetical protein
MLQISKVEIEDLDHLSRAKLRELWEREFAEKPPPSIGRDILALGTAYVRQERRYGGLRKPVARELNRLLSRVLGYIPEFGSSRHAITLIRKLPFPYQSFFYMVKLPSSLFECSCCCILFLVLRRC